MNRAIGDLEQMECSYGGELHYPASTAEAALYSPEDSEYRDTAHCRATLHRPVVSPAKAAAENTVRASQLGRAVIVEGLQEQLR